jgi:prepilin-type N-terminal cleavage/methylation domain-containing protein
LKRGVTLLELLVALVISAIVISYASYIFLSGNHQYINRLMESGRIAQLFRIKTGIVKSLEDPIEKCEDGKILIVQDSGKIELNIKLKTQFPIIDSLVFHCLEMDSDSLSFRDWKEGNQPRLVEYRAFITEKNVRDSLSGSVAK